MHISKCAVKDDFANPVIIYCDAVFNLSIKDKFCCANIQINLPLKENECLYNSNIMFILKLVDHYGTDFR